MAKKPPAMPVVVLTPPEPVPGRPPGGTTGARTVTTKVMFDPLTEPTAVPV